MGNILKLSAILSVSFLSGCATLNKSECLNADWLIIGMEDGAEGRQPSYVGRHRSACAAHNVIPDLSTYEQGHKQGLLQYCTEPRGYEAGRDGDEYLGVCPPELEKDFLKGYEPGLAIYYVKKDIHSLDYSISSRQREIEDTEDEIKDKEKELISDGVSKERRRELLVEINELRDEIAELHDEIFHYVEDRAVKEVELYELSHK